MTHESIPILQKKKRKGKKLVAETLVTQQTLQFPCQQADTKAAPATLEQPMHNMTYGPP